MGKLLVIVTVIGLLSSGVVSFKISEKEYENIDRVLEFGVQVFLNCLDKLKETAEKMVKDDMLRTNRISIQDSWNSFKETTNRISNEERGKGVQDDLIVAARIIRRVVLHYKDDVQKIFHAIATEQNVQLYLPVVQIFKGTIERTKANEVLSTFVTHYFPDAPSIESDPLEFLCYLLSTNNTENVQLFKKQSNLLFVTGPFYQNHSKSSVETYIVGVLKIGGKVAAEYKKIDFDQVSERMWDILREVSKKYDEIEQTESQKEKDTFLLRVSVTSRVFLFYWDRFLNTTDTPLLEKKFEVIVRQLEEQNFLQTLYEVLTPIMEWETVKDAWRLHSDFAEEFYLIGLGVIRNIYYFTDEERCSRTVRSVGMSAVVHSYPIYENLSEMGVFSEMKRLYLRVVDVAIVLAGTEEIQSFGETFYGKWKPFVEELNALVKEERHKPHILLPQVRAIARMFLQKFVAVSANIDDDRVRDQLTKWSKFKSTCVKKILDHGVCTEDQLYKAQRLFVEEILLFQGQSQTQGINQKRVEDFLKALDKVLLVVLNFLYTPLYQAWNNIAV